MSKSKKENKRLESTKEYTDALQDKYSKLCAVRVDLGYIEPYNKSIMLDDANDDFNHMLSNRRSKPSIFKDQVGYMCLKEYTQDKGVHLHLVLLYDGNKVHKDAHMGDKIGEYWKKLTNDRGSYHNCNRNKYKYEGIGMINHNDVEKRENFDKYVTSYLCKDDEEQDIASVKSNSKDRAFVRGIMPKKKNKSGRPRGK